MRPKLRLRWLLGILALIGITAGAIVLVWPRDRRLLTLAAPVANVHGWYLDDWADAIWLDDRSLLFFRKSGHNANGYRLWDAFRYDTIARRETPLPGLGRLFAASNASADYEIDAAPNGKRLLWPAGNGDQKHCATLEGDGDFHYHEDDYEYSYWLRDGGSIIEFMKREPTGFYQTRIVDPVNGKTLQTYPIPKNCPLNVPDLSLGSTAIGDLVPLSERRILAFKINEAVVGSGPSVDVYEFGISPDAPAVKQYTVRFSRGQTVLSVLFSPQGNRVAWLIHKEREQPLTALMHRVIPAIKVKTEDATDLFVSRIDGGEMREVGYFVNAQVPGDDASSASTNFVKWKPDGKSFSFIYRETLYTVPAD